MFRKGVAVDYKITYISNTGEDRTVQCNNFEDAERIAQFIANMSLVSEVVLNDGFYNRNYQAEKRSYSVYHSYTTDFTV